MTGSIPTVTHLKTMSTCSHSGASWNVALIMAIKCMQLDPEPTIPERNAAVQDLLRGQAVWVGGHLLHGELT